MPAPRKDAREEPFTRPRSTAAKARSCTLSKFTALSARIIGGIDGNTMRDAIDVRSKRYKGARTSAAAGARRPAQLTTLSSSRSRLSRFASSDVRSARGTEAQAAASAEWRRGVTLGTARRRCGGARAAAIRRWRWASTTASAAQSRRSRPQHCVKEAIQQAARARRRIRLLTVRRICWPMRPRSAKCDACARRAGDVPLAPPCTAARLPGAEQRRVGGASPSVISRGCAGREPRGEGGEARARAAGSSAGQPAACRSAATAAPARERPSRAAADRRRGGWNADSRRNGCRATLGASGGIVSRGDEGGGVRRRRSSAPDYDDDSAERPASKQPRSRVSALKVKQSCGVAPTRTHEHERHSVTSAGTEPGRPSRRRALQPQHKLIARSATKNAFSTSSEWRRGGVTIATGARAERAREHGRPRAGRAHRRATRRLPRWARPTHAAAAEKPMERPPGWRIRPARVQQPMELRKPARRRPQVRSESLELSRATVATWRKPCAERSASRSLRHSRREQRQCGGRRRTVHEQRAFVARWRRR